MDIHITAPTHEKQEGLALYYTEDLKKRFGQYKFVQSVELKVVTEKEEAKVSISMLPSNGAVMFATGQNKIESSAYQDALHKIRRQIEKYKEIHYRKRDARRS